jgi:hypothetical protein
VTTTTTIDYASAMKLAAEMYESIARMGLYTPMQAIKLTVDRLGFADERVKNTLVAKYVGEEIEAQLRAGVPVVQAVRKALSTFDIHNPEAERKLVAFHQIELERIHAHVSSSELVGVGVVGGAKDHEGRVIGSIQIVGDTGESLDRNDVQKAAG